MQAATVLQGPVPPQIRKCFECPLHTFSVIHERSVAEERIRQAAEANFPAAHQVVTGEMAMAQAVGLSPQAAAAQAMAVAISGAHHHAEAKRPQVYFI